MNNNPGAHPSTADQRAAPAAVWLKVSDLLRPEVGENTFGSYLAPAALRACGEGEIWLVTHTGVARDWVSRHAWRRIEELWSRYDPAGRTLQLASRHEFEGRAAEIAANEKLEPPTESVGPDIRPGPDIGALPTGPRALQTFDSFVVAPSNAFAFDVARRVASWADGHFNPVLFHGPNGFGKTHLLQALASEAARRAPGRRVLYLNAERFMSGFVRAILDRQTAAFKEDLRSADLLLIDDIQVIGGKTSTQDELFHTLACLTESGRRVVVAADRPASALSALDPRLRSHLSAGLACGVEPADRDLRLGILQRKLQAHGELIGCAPSLRVEVVDLLVDKCADTIREMEGALNILVAQAGVCVGELTLEQAQKLLRVNLKGVSDRRITVDEIQKAVCLHFGLKQADLLSERRTRAVARPRQAGMWLAKQLTTRSLPDIGRRFGNRDHTTVLHAVRRIDELRQSDVQLAQDLDALLVRLGG